MVTDGCGVPCFVLSLASMATCWANLGEAAASHSTPLGRIGRAMQAAPEFVSGDDRLDLALARATRKPMVTKIGAQGLFCGALLEPQVGFAIKVLTGVSEARPIAAWHILERWFPGILPREAIAPWETLLNLAGKPVGTREYRW